MTAVSCLTFRQAGVISTLRCCVGRRLRYLPVWPGRQHQDQWGAYRHGVIGGAVSRRSWACCRRRTVGNRVLGASRGLLRDSSLFLYLVETSATHLNGTPGLKQFMQPSNNHSNHDPYTPQQLPHLLQSHFLLAGHRNWIVIADGAYPHHANPAIETILSTGTVVDVLDHLLPVLDAQKHIQPHVFFDKEMSYLEDSLLEESEDFRSDLLHLLEKYPQESVLHEELLRRIDATASAYNILVIKTATYIPYTTVFIELRCGYWNPGSEKKLRSRMKSSAVHAQQKVQGV